MAWSNISLHLTKKEYGVISRWKAMGRIYEEVLLELVDWHAAKDQQVY